MKRSLLSLKSGNDNIEVFNELFRVWNNTASMNAYQLQMIYRLATASTAPILECGSGLSTVVLSIAADLAGVPVITLENSDQWAGRTRKALEDAQTRSVTIHVSDSPEGWYSLPDALPDCFGLVIIDGPGPTGDIRERGRIYSVLKDQIKDAVIFADDVSFNPVAKDFDQWVFENERVSERYQRFAIVRTL